MEDVRAASPRAASAEIRPAKFSMAARHCSALVPSWMVEARRLCDNPAGVITMNAEDFRGLALDMQGAVEGAHMGHPDFRANGRIFATLHPGDRKGMVKLTPDEQREFMRASPGMFVPSSGAWGRQGCTDVQLDKADQATVRGAMILAWQGATSKPPVKSRPKALGGSARGMATRTRTTPTRAPKAAAKNGAKGVVTRAVKGVAPGAAKRAVKRAAKRVAKK